MPNHQHKTEERVTTNTMQKNAQPLTQDWRTRNHQKGRSTRNHKYNAEERITTNTMQKNA